MTEVKIDFSDDKKQIKIGFSEPITLNVKELEYFIRDLAFYRANMQPRMPEANLTSETVISTVPCNRWCVDLDPHAPTQIRLYLQHLGFGWVWLSLTEKLVEELTEGMQQCLRRRPRLS